MVLNPQTCKVVSMTAMDPRILAAVFASIAALTVSGTGAIDSIDELDTGGLTDSIEIPSGIVDFLGHITENPEPEHQVTVTAEFKSVETQLEIGESTVTVSEFDTLESEARKIESNEDIEFSNFTGLIEIGNGTVLQGRSEGLSSGSLNLTEDMHLDLGTDAEELTVSDAERMPVSMDNVDIELSAEAGTDLTTSNAPLNINSFTGEIVLRPEEERIVFEGLVDTVDAGSTRFSG